MITSDKSGDLNYFPASSEFSHIVTELEKYIETPEESSLIFDFKITNYLTKSTVQFAYWTYSYSRNCITIKLLNKDLKIYRNFGETCNPITVTVTVVNNNSSQKEFETFKFEMSKLFSYLYPNKKVTVLNRNLSDLNQSDLINVDLILHDESLHTVDVLNSSIYNRYVNMVNNK